MSFFEEHLPLLPLAHTEACRGDVPIIIEVVHDDVRRRLTHRDSSRGPSTALGRPRQFRGAGLALVSDACSPGLAQRQQNTWLKGFISRAVRPELPQAFAHVLCFLHGRRATRLSWQSQREINSVVQRHFKIPDERVVSYDECSVYLLPKSTTAYRPQWCVPLHWLPSSDGSPMLSSLEAQTDHFRRQRVHHACSSHWQ